MFRKITLSVTLLLLGGAAMAQNPIIRDQFTADPSALVVGDRIYVFRLTTFPHLMIFPARTVLYGRLSRFLIRRT